MKRAFLYHFLVFLILVFLIIFLIVPFDDQIIVITIVIPGNFIPYYDWLLDFPGWRRPQHLEPLPPIPTYYGYQSVTTIYYPLSYTIGNPFVIGYWRSEGVTLPREEAYQQLTKNYLPSPDEVVFITDPDQFPSLDGIRIEKMWGLAVCRRAT